MWIRLILCFVFSLALVSAHVRRTLADDINDELVQLVVNLLGDSDKDMRALGYEQIRTEAPGKAATEKFATLLQEVPPQTRVGLLSALADRGDNSARPAVVELLQTQPTPAVRIAAIRALGLLGTTRDTPRFVEYVSQGTADERTAAIASLVALRGDDVSKAIAQQMKGAGPDTQVELIRVLTTRRALDVIPDLLQAALGADATVRSAAMQALGELGNADQIPGMVQGVLKAKRGAEQAAAEKNLMFVCRRTAQPDQQADALLDAMDQLNAADQVTLLSSLGRVGGPSALKVIEQALHDRKQHSAGLRALCNWPDASVAPQLIEVVKTDKHRGHGTTALRALIRIAPLPDGRTDLQKLDLLKQAMQLCQRDQERKLALKRASAIRVPETLRFVLPYLDQPGFTEQACETIVELAHHRNLREPNEAEFHQALDRVIATSKNATVVDRANRYKRDETWVRPK
ncbi:MAG: HEAT repeat domain-containing protein [Planctomycetaceae bacterium]|nr:HEAT repeat domain-containing protein [Planctomycetaceae bacterium]